MSAGEFNARTIAEFRANHGRVGGAFEGAPMLVLHSVGARTGQPHVNPLMYLADGERYVVFATKGGADHNPAWYHNLVAHPDVQIEVGDETFDVHADEARGAERDALYQRQADTYPVFASYERKAPRTIPVMVLTPTPR